MKALNQTAVSVSKKNNIIQQAMTQHRSSIRHQRTKQTLKEYELVQTIGRGAFGEVKLARHKTTSINALTQIK